MRIDEPIARLEQAADNRFIELGPFWAAVRELSDQGIVEPTPELAKRVGWRISTGQCFDEALRISVDEVLEESIRNSL
ncbi:MAG: hypothetical protein JWN99_1219 [Ilumatobacteraceae bacterium]|nr:hypothetical protein [Ilumatobacteraceae bacterium]